MKTQLPFVLGTVLILASASLAGRAQDSHVACPDVRATPVPARVDRSTDTRRCGFGIRIFGLGLSLFGPECPDKKFIYPAHQECKGDAHPGFLCTPGGFLDVEVEDCDCGEATVFGTGLLIPSCDCLAGGVAGHVQDASSGVCPPEV